MTITTGVVYQTNALWKHLTLSDHLSLFARHLQETYIPTLLNHLVKTLHLALHRNKVAKDLSGIHGIYV